MLNITKYQMGGVIDTDAMTEDLRSDATFFRNGNFTAKGKTRLAAIEQISHNQEEGLTYKVDKGSNTFKIVDSKGNKVDDSEGRGIGTDEKAGKFYGLVSRGKKAKKEISNVIAEASFKDYFSSFKEKEKKEELALVPRIQGRKDPDKMNTSELQAWANEDPAAFDAWSDANGWGKKSKEEYEKENSSTDSTPGVSGEVITEKTGESDVVSNTTVPSNTTETTETTETRPDSEALSYDLNDALSFAKGALNKGEKTADVTIDTEEEESIINFNDLSNTGLSPEWQDKLKTHTANINNFLQAGFYDSYTSDEGQSKKDLANIAAIDEELELRNSGKAGSMSGDEAELLESRESSEQSLNNGYNTKLQANVFKAADYIADQLAILKDEKVSRFQSENERMEAIKALEDQQKHITKYYNKSGAFENTDVKPAGPNKELDDLNLELELLVDLPSNDATRADLEDRKIFLEKKAKLGDRSLGDSYKSLEGLFAPFGGLSKTRPSIDYENGERALEIKDGYPLTPEELEEKATADKATPDKLTRNQLIDLANKAYNAGEIDYNEYDQRIKQAKGGEDLIAAKKEALKMFDPKTPSKVTSKLQQFGFTSTPQTAAESSSVTKNKELIKNATTLEELYSIKLPEKVLSRSGFYTKNTQIGILLKQKLPSAGNWVDAYWKAKQKRVEAESAANKAAVKATLGPVAAFFVGKDGGKLVHKLQEGGKLVPKFQTGNTLFGTEMVPGFDPSLATTESTPTRSGLDAVLHAFGISPEQFQMALRPNPASGNDQVVGTYKPGVTKQEIEAAAAEAAAAKAAGRRPLLSTQGINTPIGQIQYNDIAQFALALRAKNNKLAELGPVKKEFVDQGSMNVQAARDIDQATRTLRENQVTEMDSGFRNSDAIMSLISKNMTTAAKADMNDKILAERGAYRRQDQDRVNAEMELARQQNVANSNLKNQVDFENRSAENAADAMAAQADATRISDWYRNLGTISKGLQDRTNAAAATNKTMVYNLAAQENANKLSVATTKYEQALKDKRIMDSNIKKDRESLISTFELRFKGDNSKEDDDLKYEYKKELDKYNESIKAAVEENDERLRLSTEDLSAMQKVDAVKVLKDAQRIEEGFSLYRK